MPTDAIKGGYFDFDLSIWKEGDSYCAKVIDSPAGQSTKCHLPLPFHDLLRSDLLLRLESAILHSAGQFRGAGTPGGKMLCEFGQQMFDGRKGDVVSWVAKRSTAPSKRPSWWN